MDSRYNLLDEPWIKVLDDKLEIKKVSIKEIYLNAHKYLRLAGETPTQDITILRLLLSIHVTVFYRYDFEGNRSDIAESDVPQDEVLDRWEEYYEKGQFDASVYFKYLEEYRDKFYLYHDKDPFWQVSELQYGTSYDIKCFIGNMKESNNKSTSHHFSMFDGDAIDHIQDDEIARWLIFLNGYAVNIKADKKAPGTTKATGTGRLGRLGIVIAEGKNLFDCLMMNMCALNIDEIWGEPKPVWEEDLIKLEQGVEIAPPDNLPELYTIQSRRIKLNFEGDKIIGFNAIGGQFYDTVNDPTEPMTLWRKKSMKSGENEDIIPRTHSKDVYSWREFPCLVMGNEKLPGIIVWIKKLCKFELIDRRNLITFRMIGFQYGDGMSYTYGDTIDDSLQMSLGLLDEIGEKWIPRITIQVEKCEKVANEQFYFLAKKLSAILYKGDSQKTNIIKQKLGTRYFFLLNSSFREWLVSIDPEKTEMEEHIKSWEEKSLNLAKQTIDEYIVNIEKTKIVQIMEIYNECIRNLYSIYSRRGGEEIKND